MANVNAIPVLGLAPDFQGQAAEGSYYCVSNAQTAIATLAAGSAFSDTAPFISFFNRATAGGTSIYLDFIALGTSVAGTNGTNLLAAGQIDLLVDRYTSGGSVLTTSIVNPNGNAPNGSLASVRAGSLVSSAKTAVARQIFGNRSVKGAIVALGDQFMFKFGGVDAPNIISVSGIVFSQQSLPKIVIPPQGSFLMHIWSASQTVAAQYFVEMGWVER